MLKEIQHLDRKARAKAIFDDVHHALWEHCQASAEGADQRLADGTITNPIPYLPSLPYGVIQEERTPTTAAHRALRCGTRSGLLILSAIAIYDDRAWYHVSFSRGDRIPSYQDATWVKQYWFGDNVAAIQVFPAASEHVNTHPYALHLWHCLEPFYLPDFRTTGEI
jgi:hypothetical protein